MTITDRSCCTCPGFQDVTHFEHGLSLLPKKYDNNPAAIIAVGLIRVWGVFCPTVTLHEPHQLFPMSLPNNGQKTATYMASSPIHCITIFVLRNRLVEIGLYECPAAAFSCLHCRTAAFFVAPDYRLQVCRLSMRNKCTSFDNIHLTFSLWKLSAEFTRRMLVAVMTGDATYRS